MRRKTDNFNKFFNKKRNSAIKEEFRQEKKAVKKERKEAIERHFEEKRKAKGLTEGPERRTGSKPGRGSASKPARGANPVQATAGPVRGSKPVRGAKPGPGRSVPPAEHKPADFRAAGGKGRPDAKDKRGTGPGKGYEAKDRSGPAAGGKITPAASRKTRPEEEGKPKKAGSGEVRPASKGADLIPLNKYIAHGGICSRRDAAELIRQGKVWLNGKPVTEPGTRVSPDDQVKVGGKIVVMSRNFVYILLNKPKDYITTTADPQGRKTVLDLVRQATQERVYPIGRLDRNTSGVLLLTNDGDLSQKLSHPKHEIKKIYHAVLDKPLIKADFDKIVTGVQLEDGPAHVDVLAYADPKDKSQIGLEIHSGRNRIVRRIFEHLGYDVRGLDRVMYAGLTKKNVQRGNWRLLTDKEIRILKYLNSSIKGITPETGRGPGRNAATRSRAPQGRKESDEEGD